MDEDDEEMVAVDRKRVRKESALALRRLEKDEAGTKLKKKPRVLIEVKVYNLVVLHKYSALYINSVDPLPHTF